MIKNCPVCGRANPGMSGFCASCGAALAAPTPVVVRQSKRSLAVPVLTGLGTGLVLASIVLIIALMGGNSKGGPIVVVADPPATTQSVSVGAGTSPVSTTAAATTVSIGSTIAPTTPPVTTLSDDQRRVLTLEAQNKALQDQQTAQALTATAQALTAAAQARITTALPPTFTPTATSAPVAAPQPASLADRIAFSAPDENKHWNIYTIKLDGKGLSLLINRPDDVIEPAFSPDGRWLLYVMDRETDHRQIHRVRVDGSDDITLTASSYRSEYPAWSSDSSQIYFISNRNYAVGSTVTDDFVMNNDGSNQRMIIKNGGVISQNNSLITFTRFNGRSHDLMSFNGSSEQVLVGGVECDFGVISPDGSQIAYTRDWADARTVYLYDLNGNQRRISGAGEIATNPTWSPDSRYVAYLVRGASESTWEINIADTSNGQSWRIYSTGSLKFYLSWGR